MILLPCATMQHIPTLSQNILRPFPARVPPLSGESLASLVRRTTQAMGYENVARVITLLREHGQLPPHLNQLASGQVLNSLAALLRLSPDTISALTVHTHAPSLVLLPENQQRQPAEICDSKTILRYFPSAWPVCPACLFQDKVPYERLVWSFRPMPVCTKHGSVLISQCPACQRSLRWDRLDILRCRCGHRLDDAEPIVVSPHTLSLCKNVENALRSETQLLPDMSANACFWWMDRLAAAMQKTPDWLAEAGECMNLSPESHCETIAWLAAAELFCDWPARFVAFLDVFQQVDKYKTTSTGVGRRFGLLLRHAAKLEEFGWSTPADLLRTYLTDHYTAGHISGKVCLFQKPKEQAALRQRAWVTQTVAAKMLRLRHGAVAQLIQKGVLVGQVHLAGQNGRSVGLVQRDSVENLQAALRDALDIQNVAKRLGIDHRRVLDLVHGNMFPSAVRTAKGWLIPSAAVTEMESFWQQLPVGKPESRKWLSLRQATRIFGPSGLTLAMLLEMIRERRVSARMLDPSKRLNGIAVSQADLVTLVPEIRDRRGQEHGYPVHRLGKVLFDDRPIKSSVIQKWIATGLLKVCKVGRAQIIMPAEIHRFRQEYCLAQEACRILDITRTTLSRWEMEGLVKPIYGKRVTLGAGFSLYRRTDLAGLKRRHRRAA